MLQTVFIWLRQYGGIGLVVAGMALYVVTLVLEVVLGWRLSYPLSVEWMAVIIMTPATGVAVLYLQSRDEADEDGSHAVQDRRPAVGQHAGQGEGEVE
jgi:hypothetical protein